MTLLERLLVGLALLAALLLILLTCRRRRLPPPPRLLVVLAIVIWGTIGAVEPPVSMRWLRAVDDLAIAYALIALLRWLVMGLVPALGWWKPTAKILQDLLALGVGAVITVVVLQRQAGLNLVGLVATSAVLTAVIGLAAQETLKDMFGGLMMQLDPPFREGDWIEVGTDSGTVDSLHLMDTVLRKTDRSLVILPNSKVVDTPMRRFPKNKVIGNRFSIALGYEIPPTRARELLEEVIRRHPEVVPEPKAIVWISSYDDAVVRYDLIAHHLGGTERRRLQMRSDLLEQIWYALEREGWTLPLPVRQVRRADQGRAEAHPAADNPSLTAELLRRSWLFAQLAPSQVEQLAPLVRCLRFGPQETIVHEGDEGNALFQVVSGEVEVFKEDGSPWGRSVVVLGTDQIFGEMTLCTGETRTATVRARGECVLLEVERQDLLPLVVADTGLLQQLAEIVSRRRAELEKLSSRAAAERETSILEKMRLLFTDTPESLL